MKAIPCVIVCNNRWGYCATPYHAPSIAAGIRWARSSGWFWWRAIVAGRVVARGYGDDWR